MTKAPEESEGQPDDGRPEEEPLPPLHEKLIWALVWGMGIIGAIILVVWTWMLLFLN